MDLPRSEGFRQTRLLQRFIGGVARFRTVIDGEMAVCDRAEPDFVITFARPYVMTSGRVQQCLEFPKVARHGLGQ